MSSAADEIVWIVVSIIMLAIIAVVVGSPNTSSVITSFNGFFSTLLKKAVSPISTGAA